jgi:hypothetical protein
MKSKYLCLIYLNEQEMNAMPAAEMNDLNARHLDFNDDLRKSGHFIVAEALQPASQTACVRIRQGKVTVTDGPFTETKELVAGFYLIEAGDLREAIDIAARIPSAGLGTVEVRPARQLVVENRELRWG